MAISRDSIGIRALVRLYIRCENMEEYNIYWLDEEDRLRILQERYKDKLEHFIEDCEITKTWFNVLGKSKKEKIKRLGNDEIGETKGKVLRKFWKAKNKIQMEKK